MEQKKELLATTIRVDADLWHWLKKLAVKERRTVNQHLSFVIEDYRKRHEEKAA